MTTRLLASPGPVLRSPGGRGRSWRATGLVGQKMLQVLSEQKLPVDEIIVAASEKSVGKKIKYEDKELTIISVDQAVGENPDIAIFSAGAEVSLQYAKKFAEKGTYVIDNSSAWRKDKEIPLLAG